MRHEERRSGEASGARRQGDRGITADLTGACLSVVKGRDGWTEGENKRERDGQE